MKKGVIRRSYELPFIIEAKKQLGSKGWISKEFYNKLRFLGVLREVCNNTSEIEVR